jgi:FKBP-type peptidyl-prolyl cis-trans isomerase FkpA
MRRPSLAIRAALLGLCVGAAASAAAAPVVTASGLNYTETQPGKGPSPSASDVVRVHYRGRFADGREFDSSIARGKPAEFPLDRVIKCWTEGVQLMKVGGKAQLTCPPNATLHFEIELLDIVKR